VEAENAYGFQRRLEFAARAIESRRPRNVLDLGCGTGAYLLAPLARRFKAVEFVGVDSDAVSIAAAQREANLPNVRLFLAAAWPARERFDLVIASEVIEHVESPPDFLAQIAERLADRGLLLLTLPNGYGAAEWAGVAEFVLKSSGIYPLLRAVKRALISAAPAGEVARDSYAVSPHINFFAYGEILRLIRSAGFSVVDYQPRGLLCGFGWDLLVRGARLTALNQRVVDRLPPGFAADWMFLVEGGGVAVRTAYRAGVYARLRRWMNAKLARAA